MEHERERRVEKLGRLRDIVEALKTNNEFPRTREDRRDFIVRDERKGYKTLSTLPIAIIGPVLGLFTYWGSMGLLGQSPSPLGAAAIYFGIAGVGLSLAMYDASTRIRRDINLSKLIESVRCNRESIKNGVPKATTWSRQPSYGLDEIDFT